MAGDTCRVQREYLVEEMGTDGGTEVTTGTEQQQIGGHYVLRSGQSPRLSRPPWPASPQ